MNKKTPNGQRRTPNTELGSWRVAELSDGQCGSKRKPAYNLEDRLLEFSLKPSSRVLRKLLPAYDVTSKDELYSKIGSGIITLEELKKILRKNTKNKWIRYWELQFTSSSSKNKKPVPKIQTMVSIIYVQYKRFIGLKVL